SSAAAPDGDDGPATMMSSTTPVLAPPAPRFPAVAQAALDGVLSTDAVAVITTGLERLSDRLAAVELHDLEHRLVAKAVGLTLKDVRRLVEHAVARADLPGHQARERRQHEDRYLTWSEDHTGMVTLNAGLDAVTAAPIRTVIEQMVTHQFRGRRDQDPSERDRRTPGQMRADALHDLARHALGCQETTTSGVRTTMVVRMKLSDLNSGTGLGSIDGTTQPISVSELRRLAGDAEIIPQILSGASEVLDQGRRVRMFTPAQRLALLERDGGCAKCHAPPEHCEAHHIVWWRHGGRTDLSNGIMLCTRCHHDIHRQHWGIRIDNGQPFFIPPPTIDPTQQPQPGGLAALTLDQAATGPAAPGENSVLRQNPAPPKNPASKENSVFSEAARENSAISQNTRESSASK
ncbi:HNH endonuclease, partial [Demequina sp. TTPB684]